MSGGRSRRHHRARWAGRWLRPGGRLGRPPILSFQKNLVTWGALWGVSLSLRVRGAPHAIYFPRQTTSTCMCSTAVCVYMGCVHPTWRRRGCNGFVHRYCDV
eukprot:2935342-Prymnesium_polylepis.3